MRYYLVSGTSHGVGDITDRGICQQFTNAVSPYRLHRALLVALDQWVSNGTTQTPPEAGADDIAAQELETVEAQLSNLTPAIKLGGSLPSLVTELQAQERRRAAIRARLDGMKRAQQMSEADVRRFERKFFHASMIGAACSGVTRKGHARCSRSCSRGASRSRRGTSLASVTTNSGAVFLRQGDPQRFTTNSRGYATRRSMVAPTGFEPVFQP